MDRRRLAGRFLCSGTKVPDGRDVGRRHRRELDLDRGEPLGQVDVLDAGDQQAGVAEDRTPRLEEDLQPALPGRAPSEKLQAKRVRQVEDKQARRDRKAARKRGGEP